MTDAELCNMALGHLGISTTIADLQSEQSNEARNCRTFFTAAKELALEEAPWPFAERMAPLQQIEGVKYGWSFRYRYPNDCLFAREITLEGLPGLQPEDIDGTTFYPQFRNKKIPFKVMEDNDNGGKAILCNQEDAILIYTARIKNLTGCPMSFLMAFSLGLATMISGPLSALPSTRDRVSLAYDNAIRKAMGRAFNEGEEKEERESEFTAARR